MNLCHSVDNLLVLNNRYNNLFTNHDTVFIYNTSAILDLSHLGSAPSWIWAILNSPWLCVASCWNLSRAFSILPLILLHISNIAWWHMDFNPPMFSLFLGLPSCVLSHLECAQAILNSEQTSDFATQSHFVLWLRCGSPWHNQNSHLGFKAAILCLRGKRVQDIIWLVRLSITCVTWLFAANIAQPLSLCDEWVYENWHSARKPLSTK